MARIDDAVTRILRVKFRMGCLITRCSRALHRPGFGAGSSRAGAGSRAQSAVLLKNDNAALPLKPGKRVLVVGTAADSFPSSRRAAGR